MEVITKEIDPKPDDEIFWQGRINQADGTSSFAKQHLGIGQIKQVPKFIASFLQLENPESYTGHSFRSTAATEMANQGASNRQLMQKFGWSKYN